MVSTVRPKLFVGCLSQGGMDVARRLQEELSSEVEVIIWNQGVFKPVESYLESLTKACCAFDFAALVLSPDDTVLSGAAAGQFVHRHNVLFDLGLFMGRLGCAVAARWARHLLGADFTGFLTTDRWSAYDWGTRGCGNCAGHTSHATSRASSTGVEGAGA